MFGIVSNSDVNMTDDDVADGGGEDKMQVAANRLLEQKKSGAIEIFESKYEELKDRVEDFTKSKNKKQESGEMKEKKKEMNPNEWMENFIIIRKKKER